MDGSITETSALPIEELEARITELCGHLNAAQYRWLLLIREFDRRRWRRRLRRCPSTRCALRGARSGP
jgi:hypothetical protein